MLTMKRYGGCQEFRYIMWGVPLCPCPHRPRWSPDSTALARTSALRGRSRSGDGGRPAQNVVDAVGVGSGRVTGRGGVSAAGGRGAVGAGLAGAGAQVAAVDGEQRAGLHLRHGVQRGQRRVAEQEAGAPRPRVQEGQHGGRVGRQVQHAVSGQRRALAAERGPRAVVGVRTTLALALAAPTGQGEGLERRHGAGGHP